MEAGGGRIAKKETEGVKWAWAVPAAPASATGIGGIIHGLDGEVWGEVEADGGKVWKLVGGRIAKKETEGTKWNWAGPASAPVAKEALAGIGGTIRGIDGEIWGEVEKDGGKVWKLIGGRIAKKETEGTKWEWSK